MGSCAVETGDKGWSRDDSGLQPVLTDFRTSAALFEATASLKEDESVDTFLQRFEESESTRSKARAARSFVEGFDAADPAIASARAIAEEWRSGTDFASARPVGGYGPMFEYLFRCCVAAGVDFRTSTIARRLAWGRGSVELDVVRADGESRTIRACRALITLPVAMLRQSAGGSVVRFEPELPPAKLDAIANLQMGHAIKVVLGFRTAFWERVGDARYRHAASFRPDGEAYSVYWTQAPQRSTLVSAWAGGPRALALKECSRDELIGRALDGFARLFEPPGIAQSEFVDAAVHDWSTDPFACGAYSYVSVGGGAARAMLAGPLDDTLFFAGEATSVNGQGGTVNGALATGARAAEQIA